MSTSDLAGSPPHHAPFQQGRRCLKKMRKVFARVKVHAGHRVGKRSERGRELRSSRGVNVRRWTLTSCATHGFRTRDRGLEGRRKARGGHLGLGRAVLEVNC